MSFEERTEPAIRLKAYDQNYQKHELEKEIYSAFIFLSLYDAFELIHVVFEKLRLFLTNIRKNFGVV